MTVQAKTLKDVARAAGVSLMTVSRVVNRQFDRVRPETRQRVEDAIAALSYRPNYNGRGLRLSRKLAIGMVILDPLPTFLSDTFTTQVVAGLSNFLSGHGYSLNLQGIDPRNVTDSLSLPINRADALCVFCSGSPATRRRILQMLETAGQPTVLFQETIQTSWKDFCIIRQDDFGGSSLLTRHLIERGARHLAFIAPSASWPAIGERKRGIQSTLAAADVDVRFDMVTCRSSKFEDVERGLRSYLESSELPDGMLTGNGQIAVTAMRLLRQRGIAVPSDMRLATFHGFDFRYYSDPVLTSIRSAAYELGVRGGEEVMQRLIGGAFSSAEIILPVELEPGGST